jgi:hypothetical protein
MPSAHPRTPILSPGSIDDIPGWFRLADQRLIDWILDHQDRAVLLGAHLRSGQTLTVCDLFESPAPDDENARETLKSYDGLTRATFERNYLAFHDALPVIVQGPTSIILDHVRAGSCRLVHVDASHRYTHVAADVNAARTMLGPDGVVVFDDYRAAHTPGVAAAVWNAVHTGGLRPVCISPNKMYAVWGDATPLRLALMEWLGSQPAVSWEVQDVAGHDLVRVSDWPTVKKPRQSATSARAPRSAARRLAVDLLPPVLTRAVRRARRRLRR